MAKRLADIKTDIDKSAISFKDNLEKILDKEVWRLLKRLNEKCDVYIFSGIIRNFFLKIEGNRDIDIFLDGYISIEEIIKNYEYRRNSYGGYKITVNSTDIDLWFAQDTWAVKNTQTIIDFDLVKHIPNTAFFNFSSIIFSLSENKFFYTIHFMRFLRDRKIEMVFEPNANEALCIVNSIYYSDILKLKLGKNLKAYIRKKYAKNLDKYSITQLKHFGKILYSNEEIENRLEILK